MKQRHLLFILIAIAILSGAELFVILTTIRPSEAGTNIFWFLFLCLFLFTTSVLSILWHPIRTRIHKSSSISALASLRQVALFSLVLTLIVFFKSLSIFSIWDSIPLIISAILIEFFFQADKSFPRHESR